MSQSTLTGGIVALLIVVFVLVRRMRPQPVRPTRILIMSVVFVALLLLSLYSGSGRSLLRDLPALIATPFALVAGGVVGWVLVRFMRFWSDPQTGQLWMRGGVLFAAIYLVTLALRLGSEFIGQDKTLVEQYGWVLGVSADLVFFSIGLWITRTIFVYLRYRRHVAEGGAPVDLGPPARSY